MFEKNPLVSVIIPSLNEEKYIGYAFEGLAKQRYKNFEAIVVDAGSTDSTRKIVGKRAKFIVDKRRGISIGRNRGASESKGSILLFIDADTKPSPTLLSSYVEAFKDDGVVAATGPIYPLEKTSWYIRWGYKFVSEFFVKFTILIGMPSIVGSNFAIRAQTFNKVKGFDPNLITYEDWDLSMKVKKQGKIKFMDGAKVFTSTRRVVAWGMWGYFLYHVTNMVMYNLFRTSRRNYKSIR